MSNQAEKKVPEVYVVADNITSPLGKTTQANFNALKAGITAVKQHTDAALSAQPFLAALFDDEDAFYTGADGKDYSRFERLLVASVADALKQSDVNPADKKTLLIVSSTKGNIGLLETEGNEADVNKKVSLPASARVVASHFGFINQPVVVSNACISGVLGIITGMRLLRQGAYKNVVIVGGDVMSRFILSGFQSFQALSQQVCKPFDASRDGLNLGEGAATIILSTAAKYAKNVKVLGGSVSNDANHISAPSRTGAELAQAITYALADARKHIVDMGFISAHGTATLFNDEMEASAINKAGLQNIPVNSLKANYGHTLGAAGLIECIASVQALKQGVILPSPGYSHSGVTNAINICTTLTQSSACNFLKTASGFGGCNAAVIFGK